MLRKITMLLILFPLVAGAAPLQHSFTWRSDLNATEDPGTLQKVQISSEVFDGCHAFPRDLRILDDQDTQWPFYLWEDVERTQLKPYPATILNQSVVETPDPYLRIELKLDLGAGPGRMRHNQVTLEIPGSDFIQRVEVLGSDDRKSWGLLSAGFLINYRQPTRVTNNLIRYPQSDHPFLQLRIYPNARDNKLPAQATRIKVEGRQVQSAGTWEPVPLTLKEITDKSHGPGVRVYELDTGFNRRPVERLTLYTTPGDYFRLIRIYGRHTEMDDWRVVQSGEIHRVGEDEKNTLTLSSCNYRQLKLIIHNQDDEPVGLERVTAEAITRYLVFEVKSTARAGLYYGSAQAAKGQYDLQRRQGTSRAEEVPLAGLGKREDNRNYRAPLLDPWLPWIGGGAVALISLLVIWIVVRMLRTGGLQEE